MCTPTCFPFHVGLDNEITPSVFLTRLPATQVGVLHFRHASLFEHFSRLQRSLFGKTCLVYGLYFPPRPKQTSCRSRATSVAGSLKMSCVAEIPLGHLFQASASFFANLWVPRRNLRHFSQRALSNHPGSVNPSHPVQRFMGLRSNMFADASTAAAASVDTAQQKMSSARSSWTRTLPERGEVGRLRGGEHCAATHQGPDCL